jgi:hypothetical protein
VGEEAKDKLTMKYQRYFFKEDNKMNNCKPGYRWCPITKKCLPKDDVKYQGRKLHRGQGEGPMGKPFKEADDLIDLAFDEGFEVFGKAVKARKQVDRILDAIEEGMVGDTLKSVGVWTAADMGIQAGISGAQKLARRMKRKKMCKAKFKPGTPQFKQCMQAVARESEDADFGKGTISTSGRPYDHPRKLRVHADVEECGMDMEEQEPDSFGGEHNIGPSEEEYSQKHTNDINHVPNQNGRALYSKIRKQMAENNKMNWMNQKLNEGLFKMSRKKCSELYYNIKKQIAIRDLEQDAEKKKQRTERIEKMKKKLFANCN